MDVSDIITGQFSQKECFFIDINDIIVIRVCDISILNIDSDSYQY